MRKETNDYGLGDVIKRATSAVGIKPCTGCQKRATQLNNWGRRNFIGRGMTGALVAGFSAKNAVLGWAWKQAGVTIPLGANVALGLVRTLNTMQNTNKGYRGRYATQEEMWIDPMHGIVGQLANAYGPVREWLDVLNITTNVVLPGWTLDFAVVSTGYRLILAGAKDVLITDEVGVIYHANRPLQPVPASSLASAKDFPDAVVYNKFRPSWTRRILDFFVPTVYAGAECLSHDGHTCEDQDGACNCALICCIGCNAICAGGPPAGYYTCYFNAGVENPNTWIYCGNCRKGDTGCTQCQTCAYNYYRVNARTGTGYPVSVPLREENENAE
jgi:hypothetical protein